MSAREPINLEEKIIASAGGLGLLLAITGGLLIGMGTADDSTASVIAYMGLGIVFLAGVSWLVALRPWEKFDDLITPYYTGHHHDEHHDEHASPDSEYTEVDTAEATAVQAAVAEAKAPPVDTLEPVVEEAAEPVQEVQQAVEEAETPPAEEVAPVIEEAKPAKAESKPPPPEATPAKPDKLQKVQGIGPKTEKALHDAGILTFAGLVAKSEDEIQQILDDAGLSNLTPTTWREQAQFLADNDKDGLQKYLDSI